MLKPISQEGIKNWKQEVRIVLDYTVPACEPWGGRLNAGQRLRVINSHGSQAVDLLCYNAADTEERYNAPNTMKIAGTIFLTTGHKLYSDLARPLFTIINDTYGHHDTIGGCCSEPSNSALYGVENSTGCRENFLRQLAEYNLGRRDIVPNVNLFMSVPVGTDGKMEIAKGNCQPGEFIDLKAEMDVLAVLSNCPQINNPCNDFNPTPVRVIIWEPKE